MAFEILRTFCSSDDLMVCIVCTVPNESWDRLDLSRGGGNFFFRPLMVLVLDCSGCCGFSSVISGWDMLASELFLISRRAFMSLWSTSSESKSSGLEGGEFDWNSIGFLQKTWVVGGSGFEW